MATVLTVGDCHCPGMKRGYDGFLKRVADEYQPDRIVFIGDVIDWASISYHEKNVSLPAAADEVRKARRQVQTLHRAFPKADWMLGNHDVLPARQVRSAGLPDGLLRNYNDYWEVDWKVNPRLSHLKIDGVEYSHGENGPQGQRAALKQAKERFRSQVIGHLHSEAGVEWYCNGEFRVFGMSVGWGGDIAKMQFEYGRKFNRKPILGCGVVVDGKRAYFEPWLLKSR